MVKEVDVSVYLLKKSLSHKIRKQLTLTGNKFESLVIEFDKNMFSSKKNLIVSIFYIAPTSPLKLFNQKLETTLDIIQREKKYSCIMGDFKLYRRVFGFNCI